MPFSYFKAITTERFNHISFILLIAVGLFSLIFTSVRVENLILANTILE